MDDSEIIKKGTLCTTFDENKLMNALGEVLSKVAPDKLNSTRYGVMGDKYLMINLE